LLRRREMVKVLPLYTFTRNLSSFFFFSFKLTRKDFLRLIIRHFKIYNYYSKMSLNYCLIFKYNPLYVVWNFKKNQLFINFLNSYHRTINTVSTGFVLNALKQQGKSNRRKFRGIFLMFNYVKKKTKRLLRSGCLVFFFKKWRKINNYFFEKFISFFQTLKKSPKLFISIKPNFCYGRIKIKKHRSIKRRITKRLVSLEKTFLDKNDNNKNQI